MGKREKASYVVQSVTNALDLLEAFGGDRAELGLTDLSKRLGLHKNNVFRLAATLESRQFLEQNKATGNYRLGLKLLEFRRAFIAHRNLFELAHPILERVARECGETAYLGVLRGELAVYLDVVETTHPVRVALRVGTGLPLHCTAMGKVLIAFAPPDELERLLGKALLGGRTPRTITDKGELLRELERVRQRGYALDLDEYEEGVRCIAAPVRDWSGRVVAGVSVNGPAYRLDDARLERELAPLVCGAARELSQLVGWTEQGRESPDREGASSQEADAAPA
ncbi:MAG: IclR family transcriptional regulator [Deferrisomatales bacterium]